MIEHLLKELMDSFITISNINLTNIEEYKTIPPEGTANIYENYEKK